MSEPPRPTEAQCDEWWAQACSMQEKDGLASIHYARLVSAWGYEQGARAMQERAARLCESDTERSHVLAQAIRALDPAPVKPCPCGTMYCAIESGSNVPEDYAARCRRRIAAAQVDVEHKGG